MKVKITRIVMVLLFIIGLGCILYPIVNDYLLKQANQQTIEEFKVTKETIQQEEESLQQLYEEIKNYNQTIDQNGQSDLLDPFSYEVSAFDLGSYGIQDNVIGYINIPRMNVELPIYLGATQDNLALGAGNSGYTSIPIGGINSNAVLAAHRGYRGTPMFRDIESLEIGDRIYITTYWQTLVYEVVETKVILPTEINEVRIQEGRDLITLVTCHPYTKNYQRYVVYCERIEEDDNSTNTINTGLEFKYLFQLDELTSSQRLIFLEKWIPKGVVLLLLLLIMLRVLFGIRKKYKSKKKQV